MAHATYIPFWEIDLYQGRIQDLWKGGGGGAAATASATGAKVFGGPRLKTLDLWNFNGDARHRCIVDLEGTGGIWGMLLQKSFHKFD